MEGPRQAASLAGVRGRGYSGRGPKSVLGSRGFAVECGVGEAGLR